MGHDLTGSSVLHYRILEKIGEGGMGAVYKAEDSRMRRTVALKFLGTGLLSDPTARKRFAREAQAAGALDHPNICTVYGLEETQDRAFIVMAYVAGPTLARKLCQGMTLAEILDCAIGVAEGCRFAHNQGIVHRDLKPANIILSAQGTPKITDFGLARVQARSRLTLPGTVMGTITSMAPEQLIAEDADARTDIWALGALLYEMLTGKRPFERGNLERTMHAILHETPPAPNVLDPCLPKEFSWLFEKALAKARGERYQTMDEFAADLKAIRKRLLPSQENLQLPQTSASEVPTIPAAADAAPPHESVKAPKTAGLGWPMLAAIAAVALVIIALLFWVSR